MGGGPAGSAAAFTLAAAGLDVQLIDKANFPRQKLCGGLVTMRSRRSFESIFGQSWDASLFRETHALRFFSDGRLLAQDRSEQTIHLTQRFDFDHYLLGLAQARGATLQLGHAVTSIDLDGRRLTLSDGSTASYRFLIGADGANSIVAKALFGRAFDPRKVWFCLESEIEAPDSECFAQNVIDIDFAAAPWGYGWIFPKRDSVTVGIGGMQRKNPDLKARFARFCAAHRLDPSRARLKGQFLPFCDFRGLPSRGSALVCGDAGGFVDPITGEGIGYAMQSGRLAGAAIAEAVRIGDDARAGELYRQSLAPTLASLASAARWTHAIYPPGLRRAFDAAIADAGTMRQGYLDLLAGTIDYDDLPALFRRQFSLGMRKLGRKLLPV